MLSPGNAGSVTQTNAVSSNATAANANLTGQSATQSSGGSCGCAGGTQAIGQSAANDQAAAALSLASQANASNSNIPVRVLSDGNDGSVEQTNSVDSNTTPANINATGQSADQTAAGEFGTQAIGQSADSEQNAAAASKAEQTGAKNTNVSVRVLSPGDDGDVSQSNEASSDATAGNLNLTGQHADQTQSGDSCKCGNDGESSASRPTTIRTRLPSRRPSKRSRRTRNISIRVLSPGDDGDVSQSNEASSKRRGRQPEPDRADTPTRRRRVDSTASADGLQVIGQSADSEQDAAAPRPCRRSRRTRTSRSGSCSPGDDGDVTQSNEASSKAEAGNLNLTRAERRIRQQAGGSGLQVIGQSAENEQDAFRARRRRPSRKAPNENVPVRVLSKGDGGDVEQSNEASSKAEAGNLNLTEQKADQSQEGDSCKCGSGLQVIGQSAKSEQDAAAIAATIQEKPSNTNTPIRVLSKGDDGDVKQSNEASSNAEGRQPEPDRAEGRSAEQAGGSACR